MERFILHSDLNAYYASVERVRDPSLAGKPVAVCGREEERHGVVLAKSREAGLFGVKTGMSACQARALCPRLILIEPHFEAYEKYSRLVQEIYNRFTDRIQPFGLDECWLDLSGMPGIRSYRDAAEAANRIRQRTREELGLTVSVGVSFNKIFAKLGSDLKKPDAVTLITRENFREKIWPLPVSSLLFVGRSTAQKLGRYGIRTIGDLARTPEDCLAAGLGKNGQKLWLYANGLESSPVSPYLQKDEAKSLGHGVTCTADLLNDREVYHVLLSLCQELSHRLRKEGISAGALQLFVKDRNLLGLQFQKNLSFPTQSWHELARAAMGLFRERYSFHVPVRALSVTAIRLLKAGSPCQISLFWDGKHFEKQENMELAFEKIRSRFGKEALFLGFQMPGMETKLPKDHGIHHTLPGGMRT